MTNRSPQQRRQASRLYDEALLRITLQQYDAAERLLARALDIAPDFSPAQRKLASVERQLHSKGQFYMGVRLAHEGRHHEAERAFRSVAADSPYYLPGQHWARISRREQADQQQRAAHAPTLVITQAKLRAIKYASPAIVIAVCGILSVGVLMPFISGAPQITKAPPVATDRAPDMTPVAPLVSPVPADAHTGENGDNSEDSTNGGNTPLPDRAPDAVTVVPVRPDVAATPTALPPRNGTTPVIARAASASPTRTPTARPIVAPPTRTPTATPLTVSPPAALPPTATPVTVIPPAPPTPEPTRTPTATSSVPPIVIAGSTSAATPSLVALTVHADAYLFTPDSISVAAGTRVRLTLVNDGDTTYNWVLLGTNTLPIIRITALPGRSATAEFTAPSAPGTYNVLCDIGTNAALGMKGTLVVTAR